MLLFYRQLTYKHPSLLFSRIIWTVLFCVFSCAIASTVSLLLTCRPLNAFWLSTDYEWAQTHEYTCGNSGAYIVVISVINVVFDFVITLMPTALIWNLKLPTRQKIVLWALLTVGIMASVAAVFRIIAADDEFYHTYDFVCTYCRKPNSPFLLYVKGLIQSG